MKLKQVYILGSDEIKCINGGQASTYFDDRQKIKTHAVIDFIIEFVLTPPPL